MGMTRSASTGDSSREALAHAHAGGVDLDAQKPRVGTREIEELEDAERAALVLRHDLVRLDSLVDHHQLARPDFPLEFGADEVERAGLRGDHPVAVEPPETERAHPARVAEGDQLSLGERDDGERAVQLAHRVRDGVGERSRIVRDQRGDHLGVGRRGEPVSQFAELLTELGSVREVAVVTEGDRARAAVLHERLCVPPLRRSCGRVTRVADREVTAQPAQLLLVEDLRDEPHVAQCRERALRRTPRCRPTPGRGAGARTGRSRSGVRRRAPATGLRTGRTFSAPCRCAGGPWRRAAPRRPARRRAGSGRRARCGGQLDVRVEPEYSSASRSASSRPPSDDVVRERQHRGSLPDEADERRLGGEVELSGRGRRRGRRRRFARRPGTKRTSGTSPMQPTTGVGGIDRPSVSL